MEQANSHLPLGHTAGNSADGEAHPAVVRFGHSAAANEIRVEGLEPGPQVTDPRDEIIAVYALPLTSLLIGPGAASGRGIGMYRIPRPLNQKGIVSRF